MLTSMPIYCRRFSFAINWAAARSCLKLDDLVYVLFNCIRVDNGYVIQIANSMLITSRSIIEYEIVQVLLHCNNDTSHKSEHWIFLISFIVLKKQSKWANWKEKSFEAISCLATCREKNCMKKVINQYILSCSHHIVHVVLIQNVVHLQQAWQAEF